MKVPVVAAISLLILAGCAHDKSRESEAVGASGPISTTQRSTGGSYLSETDQTFIKQAAQGGETEVKMGRLGAQRGQSQAVRELGQKLVQDHSQANQELKLLAAQKSATLPTDTPVERETMLSHLQGLEGAEFDLAFKKDAIATHQQAIQKFKAEMQQTPDADVRAFVQKTLPVLEQHLKMAEAIPGNAEPITQGIQSSQQNPQPQNSQPPKPVVPQPTAPEPNQQ